MTNTDTLPVLTEGDAEAQYDYFLDEIYGRIDLGIVTLTASQALKGADPIAYRVGLGDYIDSMQDEWIVEGYTA